MFPAVLLVSLLHNPLALPVAVDSAKYRIEVTLDQKATAGTASQVSQASLVGFLTMHLKDSAGGKIAQFLVDSITVAPGKAIPANLQGSTMAAKGLTYRAMIVRGLPVGGFKLSAPQPHAALFTSALDNLFPGFKPGMALGAQWSDTVTVASVAPVVDDRTTIIAWHVTGLENGIATVEASISGSSHSKSQTPTGERVTNGTMSGRRELTGPLAGPMTHGSIVSEQPITTSVGNDGQVKILAKTTITMTRLP